MFGRITGCVLEKEEEEDEEAQMDEGVVQKNK
jgi:hypothetical protein